MFKELSLIKLKHLEYYAIISHHNLKSFNQDYYIDHEHYFSLYLIYYFNDFN